MNKKLTTILAAVLITTIAFGQKVQETDVPASVIAAFKTKFPGIAKTTWEIENVTEYEVGFKLNGENTSANFDNTGKWLETETEIKTSALPASVQAALSKDFQGYKVEEASKIESVKDGNIFEAEIEKGEEEFDVLFTADGNLLSKTKEEEENGEKD